MKLINVAIATVITFTSLGLVGSAVKTHQVNSEVQQAIATHQSGINRPYPGLDIVGQSGEVIGVKGVDFATLRKEPQGKILAILNPTQTVVILGRKKSQGTTWYKVAAPKNSSYQIGWVRTETLKHSTN